MKVLRVLVFLLTTAFYSEVSATVVTGKITDAKSEALPFVNVFVANTTRGTTANADGIFSIDLQPGTYELSFKIIGYKIKTENITVGTEKISLDIQLEEETYTLKGVVIDAGAEDPAYRVIREAIKKRKFYFGQVEEYSSDVYVKGIQKITKYPKKIFGIKVDFEGQLDTATGIIYLSESVSQYNFKKPDKVHEEMISSKVSGNNRAFSYNRASDMMFNFYESTLNVGAISNRGFISPIASDAMLYYKYRLDGTFFENGEMVNKIEVIPKRKSDPVFRGYIYITENTWRIHSADLYLTKDAQINFVDTLRLEQTFLPVSKDTWMVFSNKFTFVFSFMGFEGNGTYLGVNSNYNLSPRFPENYFKGEVMKVDEQSNKKDSAYWKTIRPVPLTSEEKTDYHKKDSMQVIRESKPFMDSLDRKSNKLKLGKLFITGYSYEKRWRKTRLDFSPLIKNVQFNTVQGMTVGTEISYRKMPEDNRDFFANTTVQYGFTSKKIYGTGEFSYQYNPEKRTRLGAAGGIQAAQFNRSNPISQLVNTIYTLADERNWMKIYERTFGGGYVSTELTNGLFTSLTAVFAKRFPLMNSDYFVLFPSVKNKRVYTSNNPEFPQNDSMPSFVKNESFDLEAQIRWRPGQKYYSRPHQKIILGSKFPFIIVAYKKAIPRAFGSDADYDLLKLTLRDDVSFKRLGSASYSITGGKFLTRNYICFMDYYHFNGNLALWSNFNAGSFNLLDYYGRSSSDWFTEAHYVHNFGGLLLSRIPLLKKAMLNEIGGLHVALTANRPLYYELSIGVEKFSVFRVDFVSAFEEDKFQSSGIRFGIKFN